jgi:hypothetical protein
MKHVWNDESDGVGQLLMYAFKWLTIICASLCVIAVTRYIIILTE